MIILIYNYASKKSCKNWYFCILAITVSSICDRRQQLIDIFYDFMFYSLFYYRYNCILTLITHRQLDVPSQAKQPNVPTLVLKTIRVLYVPRELHLLYANDVVFETPLLEMLVLTGTKTLAPLCETIFWSGQKMCTLTTILTTMREKTLL